MWPITDRTWFGLAVAVYGISTVYSILLWRRGFRRDNRVIYVLLLAGAVLHTVAMMQRGFSLARCPINNLYEATVFIAWTVVATYLAIGGWSRLRFLGAIISPFLTAVGVFALMPALDQSGPATEFSHGLESLHAALVLLAYGAFGIAAAAATMYLSQEHDLKFNKLRAVEAFMPPIQRLDSITHQLVTVGLGLLTAGLGVGVVYLKQARGSYLSSDPFVLYCALTWVIYFTLFWCGRHFVRHGRRFAWGALASFAFVILTFWGVWLLPGMHNRRTADTVPPAGTSVPAGAPNAPR